MTCVDVCPVDCFYEGENMLVINPDECIDCGVCEPECPVDAIIPHTVNLKGVALKDTQKWFDINEKYSQIWPNIDVGRPEDVPVDAEKWDGVPNKYEKYFSDKPG
jgi:ferredoxin|tara:strand:+ start:19 stop:333 length:315 start_codon:yes stop_codon:yes gene_type:complete